LKISVVVTVGQGAHRRRHGVDWGNSLPFPHKRYFSKSSRNDEKKNWGYEGDITDITSNG